MKTLLSLVLLTLAQVIYSSHDVAAIATFVTPTLNDAINHQDETVALYEELFPQSAGPARAQWNERKAIAQSRLAEINSLTSINN